MVVLLKGSQGITKCISIHPESYMKFCTKFPGNPKKLLIIDISLRATNVNLMVGLATKMMAIYSMSVTQYIDSNKTMV